MENNNITYIKKILHSFYEGMTTPEEEKMLYAYFSGEEIAPELLREKELFLKFFSLQSEIIVPQGLENKIERLIDRLDQEERDSRVVTLKPEPRRFDWKWITGIAASIVIVVSVCLFTIRDNNQLMADTYSNPEEAYVETQRALLLVSNKLNKGFEQVESAQKNLERTNKIIGKSIQL